MTWNYFDGRILINRITLTHPRSYIYTKKSNMNLLYNCLIHIHFNESVINWIERVPDSKNHHEEDVYTQWGVRLQDLGYKHNEQYENQHATLIMIKLKVFILFLRLIWKPETTCETRMGEYHHSAIFLREYIFSLRTKVYSKSIYYYYECSNSFLALQTFGRVWSDIE